MTTSCFDSDVHSTARTAPSALNGCKELYLACNAAQTTVTCRVGPTFAAYAQPVQTYVISAQAQGLCCMHAHKNTACYAQGLSGHMLLPSIYFGSQSNCICHCCCILLQLLLLLLL